MRNSTDDFHRANIKNATAIDYTCNTIVIRSKGDGNRLRRYARRKLKQQRIRENIAFLMDVLSEEYLETREEQHE